LTPPWARSNLNAELGLRRRWGQEPGVVEVAGAGAVVPAVLLPSHCRLLRVLCLCRRPRFLSVCQAQVAEELEEPGLAEIPRVATEERLTTKNFSSLAIPGDLAGGTFQWAQRR